MNRLNGNIISLANALELGTAVLMRVAGDAIANTVNGKLQAPANLDQALAAKIQTTFAKYGERKQ